MVKKQAASLLSVQSDQFLFEAPLQLSLEAICEGAVASVETMLTRFPAAGWLFSTLIIQSTCLFPRTPSLLIPLPPSLCSVTIIFPPPFIQYQS